MLAIMKYAQVRKKRNQFASRAHSFKVYQSTDFEGFKVSKV